MENASLTYEYFKEQIYINEHQSNLTMVYEDGTTHYIDKKLQRDIAKWLLDRFNKVDIP